LTAWVDSLGRTHVLGSVHRLQNGPCQLAKLTVWVILSTRLLVSSSRVYFSSRRCFTWSAEVDRSSCSQRSQYTPWRQRCQRCSVCARGKSEVGKGLY